MKFSFFHLMPYAGLDEAPGDWPVSNRAFSAERARDYYRTYLQMRRVHAELGNGVFNLTMQVGNLPDAVVRKGMELFRDRVLPEVRHL
jgi:hypothetical protein